MADDLLHDKDRTSHVTLDPPFEGLIETLICKIRVSIGLWCLFEIGRTLEGRNLLHPSVTQYLPSFVNPIPDILVLEVFETIEIEIETLDLFGLYVWIHVTQEAECIVIDDKRNIPR